MESQGWEEGDPEKVAEDLKDTSNKSTLSTWCFEPFDITT